MWPEDRKCERSWLLENIPGASGVILMLSEAVSGFPIEVDHRSRNIPGQRRASRRGCVYVSVFAFYDGLIEYGLAGPSLRVVSTMSVGYGEN